MLGLVSAEAEYISSVVFSFPKPRKKKRKFHPGKEVVDPLVLAF